MLFSGKLFLGCFICKSAERWIDFLIFGLIINSLVGYIHTHTYTHTHTHIIYTEYTQIHTHKQLYSNLQKLTYVYVNSI